MILSISGKIGSGKDTTGKIMQILIDSPNLINKGVKIFLKREIPKPTFTIEKWGGVLKDITCLLISCTREQLEDAEFKETELSRDWRQYFITDAENDKINNITYLSEIEVQQELERLNHPILRYDYIALTPRLLLQLLGTECGRNIIHPNIWVNALMSKYKMSYIQHKDIEYVEHKQYPNWIITDTRFPNEHKAVIDKGGINIRINRLFNTPFVNPAGITITTMRNSGLEKEHESETALDNAEFHYTIENNGTLDELIDKVRALLVILELI